MCLYITEVKITEVAFVPVIPPNQSKTIWFCCMFLCTQEHWFWQQCISNADVRRTNPAIWMHTLLSRCHCYTSRWLRYPRTITTKIRMHLDKMLYLWFVYMHKSATQPSLASTQNSFIWIESASDHSQKDWLLTERPRDTEPPYQKYRDTIQKENCTQPTGIFTWTNRTVAFKLMKLSFLFTFFFLVCIRNLW